MMSRNRSRAAFTLVEILFSVAIMAFVGTMLAKLLLRSTRSFNSKLWRQTSNKEIDRAIQKMQKFLKLATYPSENTFKGVLRDRSDNFSMLIYDENLSLGEAYSKNTKNLVKDEEGSGTVNFDSAAADYRYFGSGIKDDWTAEDFANRYDNTNVETDVMSWTSCQAGYQGIPGFADVKPRCGKHRLFLRNRSQVQRASPETYKFFQDLFLESSFCITKNVVPVGGNKGYLMGQGQYGCQNSDYIDSRAPTLHNDELAMVGIKLLARNIATVTIYHYQKPNDRSTTVGIDMVAVAPHYGTEVIKKSTQANVSLRVLPQ